MRILLLMTCGNEHTAHMQRTSLLSYFCPSFCVAHIQLSLSERPGVDQTVGVLGVPFSTTEASNDND